jgi:hypothetical protein
MKNFKAISLMMIFTALLLVSCGGVDKEKLTAQIRTDIEREFDERAEEFGGLDYTIDDFTLVKKSDAEYKGLLTTTEEGKEFNYDVEVTIDGDSYIWKIVD